jgi:arabinose-5-phosphate isomerase
MVVDDEGRLAGVVTAGDLTRLMEREPDVFGVSVSSVMNRRPKVTEAGILGAAAVYQMELHGVMALPVLGPERRPIGIVHLHDLMRAGAV